MVEPNARSAGHETRDINVWLVAGFALGLIIAAVVAYLAVSGLAKFFAERHPSNERASRIASGAPMIAPEPRLQVNEAIDLDALRAAEEAKLNSYEWVDKSAGVIRIPIARAMDLIAQRGLPTRGAGTQDASGVTSVDLQKQKAATAAPSK
jgi:hypothetical protein